ncbi:protein of unknown function [Modestobacter italicus]|uniref:Uncharacterized protein n=1 Tax=Modestobacter italicus (strain DSM 44449 / CECT 9708 / BC 501) TaxID=2732864 RepID=I4ET05_MODI5|nr:protein of unknown function [Modestobacter marinus]
MAPPAGADWRLSDTAVGGAFDVRTEGAYRSSH